MQAGRRRPAEGRHPVSGWCGWPHLLRHVAPPWPVGAAPQKRCGASSGAVRVGEATSRDGLRRAVVAATPPGRMPVTWPRSVSSPHHRCMTTTPLTRRIEGSVTTISWIPSEAVEGAFKAGFKLGVSHYDPPPPDDLGPDIDAALDDLVATDRLRFANHLRAWAEFDERRRRPGVRPPGRRQARGDQRAHRDRRVPRRIGDARASRRAGDRPRVGPLHPDQRRTHWRPDAAARPATPVRAVQVAGRLDDAGADAARRRSGRGTPDGRLSLPAPLGLRHGRHAHRQEREHPLEGLGRHRLRQAHAVG